MKTAFAGRRRMIAAPALMLAGVLPTYAAFVAPLAGIVAARQVCVREFASFPSRIPLRRSRNAAWMSTAVDQEEAEREFGAMLTRESAEMRARRDEGEMAGDLTRQKARPGSTTSSARKPGGVMLEDLLMEAGVGGGKATDELVSQLDRYHFGVVTVPDHHRENLEGMWTAIDAFFAMSGPDKKLAAGEATRIREVVGGIVGYQDHRGTNSDPSQKRFAGGNEHLDTRRVGPTGALVPSFADGAIHDQPTASELILAGRETLHAVGAAAVGAAALASGINVGELVLMIDDGSDLGEGKMTPSELRFLRYPNDAGSDGGNYVAFEPHVDTSLVTLIPVSGVPGLEVYSPSEGWVQPEGEWDLTRSDVLVLPGVFTQVITGRFRAALHRVVRTPHSPTRLSAPLFVRPRVDTVIDASLLGGKEGRLEAMHGRNAEDIHNHMWFYGRVA